MRIYICAYSCVCIYELNFNFKYGRRPRARPSLVLVRSLLCSCLGFQLCLNFRVLVILSHRITRRHQERVRASGRQLDRCAPRCLLSQVWHLVVVPFVAHSFHLVVRRLASVWAPRALPVIVSRLLACWLLIVFCGWTLLSFADGPEWRHAP